MGSSVNNDLQGKKILFIAYFYPPVVSTNIPGAMRTIKFIRNMNNGQYFVLTTNKMINDSESALSHITLPVNNEQIFRTANWDFFKVIIYIKNKLKNIISTFTSKENTLNNAEKQASFQATSNNSVTQKTSSIKKLKDFIYNISYFPDQAGPWIIPSIIKGIRETKKNKINIIFATGSPWSDLVVGYYISKVTKVPLIVDFRDPWINNPFHLSKGKFLDRFAEKLEKKIVKHASIISLNTEALKQEFIQRYPKIALDKFIVLPNGFDLKDFTDIPEKESTQDNSTTLLTHAGFLYGVRDPEVLLEAIIKANKELKPLGKKVIFKQIGNIELSYDIKEKYRNMIEDGSLILEPAVPYKECLTQLKESDYVVNIQPGTKTQVPSKLYDYLALKRPMLTITNKEGALGELIQQYNLGELYEFTELKPLVNKLTEIANNKPTNSFSGYKNTSLFNSKSITNTLSKVIIDLK